MPEINSAEQFIGVVYLWIGFGALSGVMAALLTPGVPSKPVIISMTLGLFGASVGPFIAERLPLKGIWAQPLGPISLGCSIATTAVLLLVVQAFAPRKKKRYDEDVWGQDRR
jgi:uncharacterized membrane protein YeaQ/YmgE (transglycosylase-associated protein family)